MRAYELIKAKRDGRVLLPEDIRAFIDGYTKGAIPDYQMVAMCMAVFFKGLDEVDLGAWARAMLESGEVLDLSDTPGPARPPHRAVAWVPGRARARPPRRPWALKPTVSGPPRTFTRAGRQPTVDLDVSPLWLHLRPGPGGRGGGRGCRGWAWAGRSRRCAFLEGFSLHANTWVHENNREGLERLANYGARGPLSLERLSRLPDGRLAYRMKRPSASGATTSQRVHPPSTSFVESQR